MIGLGTYKLDGETAYKIVKRGLELGYRLIDTAQLYKNEEAVGRAIRKSQVDRGDLVVITKVWLTSIKSGRDGIIESVSNSLNRLNVGYIDVLLLHGPVEDKIIESWRAIEDIYLGRVHGLEDKVKSIGVSNYGIDDLGPVLTNCQIGPKYNQIELSPFCRRDELVEYCGLNDVIIMAHSSLTKGKMFDHHIIKAICLKHECQPTKVLINWALIKGYIILPRTSNINHLEDNFDNKIMLDKDDMDQLDSIDDFFCSHIRYVDL